VLAEHENAERNATGRSGAGDTPPLPRQLTIFTPLSHEALDRLREVDLNHLTPLEAMNLLAELKRQID
jgi:DNA mismatch repair protein MutS